MTLVESTAKITPHHLARKAVVYLRQSSLTQVKQNTESQRLQYALKDTAKGYGFLRRGGHRLRSRDERVQLYMPAQTRDYLPRLAFRKDLLRSESEQI